MGAHRHATTERKALDPTAIYDPTSRRRKSPTKKPPSSLPTRFPDEDHAYHPLRRLQVAKLQQNAMPPQPCPSARTTSKQIRRRIANIADSQLWGFSVKYSPTQELLDQWQHAKREETINAERVHEEERQIQDRQLRAQQQAALVRQDYSLYLYMASKYGALDAILYCCTPFPGRLYALRIDQSVRKLQRWQRERVVALRRFWIVRLSRDVVDASMHGGIAQIQAAITHQRHAAVFLLRMRLRFAARAFRSWFHFTQRQIEVRWRFQFSRHENLRSRFVEWRKRVVHLHAFKRQLKQVARRKQMQTVVVQWIEWKARQQKLRVHLQHQWAKRQRACLAGWKAFSNTSKTQRLAAIRIQSQWRACRQRRLYKRTQQAATTISRLVRSFLARRFVSALRGQRVVAHALERILKVLEWDGICEDLEHKRALAVEHELARAARQTRFVEDAAEHAVELVQAELEKVKKNSTHQQLQVKIQQLQNEAVERGRGPRTQEVLIRDATRLLTEDAAAAARRQAESEFVRQRDALGRLCNRPVSHNLECVVCTPTALTLAEHPLVLPFALSPCGHADSILKSTSDELQQIYDQMQVALVSRDVVIRQQLLLVNDDRAL